MKTALTELIEKWEIETGSFIPNAPIYKAFIEEAKEFLDKEKQQIIDAYNVEIYEGVNDDNLDAEQYYNETFKND